MPGILSVIGPFGEAAKRRALAVLQLPSFLFPCVSGSMIKVLMTPLTTYPRQTSLISTSLSICFCNPLVFAHLSSAAHLQHLVFTYSSHLYAVVLFFPCLPLLFKMLPLKYMLIVMKKRGIWRNYDVQRCRWEMIVTLLMLNRLAMIPSAKHGWPLAYETHHTGMATEEVHQD